jgi:hypothetical protein
MNGKMGGGRVKNENCLVGIELTFSTKMHLIKIKLERLSMHFLVQHCTIDRA